MNSEELKQLIQFAHQLADLSAEIIRPYFRADFHIDQKSDKTPVTEADLSAEEAMRQLITKHYPHHGIVGEEIANRQENHEMVWILDPIDGTKAFVSGNPLFGTLIGLLSHQKPILGIINQPIFKERWVGISGQGTTFNGKAVKARSTSRLEEARFAYTSPHMFNAKEKEAIDRVSQKVAQTIFGGDCYAYGLLASGHIDIIIEASLHPHDYMALIPVIENANGVITDWNGHPLTLEGSGKVVACANATLHKKVIHTLEPS